MFSTHLLDSWLHCQLHCSVAAFSQQHSRPGREQTDRVSQCHVYAVASEQHGLLVLQSCYGDQWLGVSTPAGQGYMDFLFLFFLCKVQVKSNTKGMAWIRSLRKETQISKGFLLLTPELPRVWQLLFEVAAESCFYLHLMSVTACPPYYMHCNMLRSWMRGKTHLKLNFSFEEEGFSLLTIVITEDGWLLVLCCFRSFNQSTNTQWGQCGFWVWSKSGAYRCGPELLPASGAVKGSWI